MANTKREKIAIDQIAQSFGRKTAQMSTQMIRSTGDEIIKINQKGDGNVYYGYKQVNYAEIRKQEVYREINRILGGR